MSHNFFTLAGKACVLPVLLGLAACTGPAVRAEFLGNRIGARGLWESRILLVNDTDQGIVYYGNAGVPSICVWSRDTGVPGWCTIHSGTSVQEHRVPPRSTHEFAVFGGSGAIWRRVAPAPYPMSPWILTYRSGFGADVERIRFHVYVGPNQERKELVCEVEPGPDLHLVVAATPAPPGTVYRRAFPLDPRRGD